MFSISIACSELASAIRRVGFVTPTGIPAEPRAPDRRAREILLANVRIGQEPTILAADYLYALRSEADIADLEFALVQAARPRERTQHDRKQFVRRGDAEPLIGALEAPV